MCKELAHFQHPLLSFEARTTEQCARALMWDNMNHQDELMDQSLCSQNPVSFISIVVNLGPNLKWQGN